MKNMRNRGLADSLPWIKAARSYRFLMPGIVLWALLPVMAAWAAGENPPPAVTPWIRFDLYPAEAVALGAQWKFTNETEWRRSGVYYTNLQPGLFELEFKPVEGWMIPPFSMPVVIKPDSQIWLFAGYEKETSQPEHFITAKIDIAPIDAVEAGARWKLAAETEWRDPRFYYTNLPAINTYLEFKPIDGWVAPSNQFIAIRSGSVLSDHFEYKSIPPRPHQKMIIIGITPWQAIADGAQWKLTTDSEWREPGYYYTNWPIGSCTVEFKPIAGWITPENVPMIIREGTNYFASTSRGYRLRPQYLIDVAATNGLVSQDATPWFHTDFIENERRATWNSAETLLRNPNSWQVFGRPGDKVRLVAIANPGYQFSGWGGDASGVRNPISLVLDSNKNITAYFSPVSPVDITATQTAEYYLSPGELMVHGQVNIPVGQTLESLTWRPVLPEGWILVSVNGLGRPQVKAGTIQFGSFELILPPSIPFDTSPTNLLQPYQPYFVPINPLPFTMVIHVPDNQTGTKEIQSEISYSWKEGTNTVSGATRANPLRLVRHEPPIAILALDLSAGPPILTLHAEPGTSYTIQRQPNPCPYTNWRNMAHLRLTNSVQTWIDTDAGTNPPGHIYRASLIQ